jgi:hypothetical protein
VITYNELVTDHRFTSETLTRALKLLGPGDGLLLYRNQLLDSSHAGEQCLVVIGPGRSIPSVEAAPGWIDPDGTGGLPSRRQHLIGQVDVESLARVPEDATSVIRMEQEVKDDAGDVETQAAVGDLRPGDDRS